MARLHWPGLDPIGRRVNFGPASRDGSMREPWTTVVGVVGDARLERFDGPPRPEVFTPLAQAPFAIRSATVLLRTLLPPDGLALPTRAALRSIDPRVPLFDVRTMEDVVREATATRRYSAQLVGLLALIGLVLAAVGIHGLGAFIAGRRTHELGVRVALGAGRRDILRLVLGAALAPSAGGLAAGALAAVGVTPLLQGMLYEVEPWDPRALAAAVLVLACVAATAAYRPARRAATLDPMSSLRAE
jgi:putative ABC transport system permease protein